MLNDLTLRAFVGVQTKIASLDQFAQNLKDDERGQDTLEWVLLGGLIAAGIVGVLTVFTGKLSTMVNNVGNCIDFTSSTSCTPGF